MPKPYDVFQVEIRVRELQPAIEFYARAFEWGIYQSSPSYALIDAGQMPVLGLMVDPRFPMGVCPNLLVDDCEAMAKRAEELGGRIVVGRCEVDEVGAFTGTLDPWGGELFFWQPYSENRPSLQLEPTNPVSFLEIAAPNLEQATKYYNELCGWSFWSVAFTPNYSISEGCGLKRGVGVYAGEQAGSGIVTYIDVANLEEISAKITEAGGQVVVEPTDFPGEGRYLIFADPDGNRLGCLQAP